MKQCQICHSRKIKILHDTVFCENCEIYYNVKNGKQRIKALPISETDQRTLNLCFNCTKKTSNNISIECRIFRSYYNKLPFCRQCKSLNLVFLKNLFFKNFLLYKKDRKSFGIFTLLLLFLISWFWPQNLIFFNFYLVLLTENFSFFKFIVFAFIWFFIKEYSFLQPILIISSLIKICFTIETYYDVPVDLLSAKQIENHFDRLKINTSSEVEPNTRLLPQKKKLNSCFELRNNK